MCYALAVNWVPEKRSRSEKLGDIGDVDELKIDDDDDKGNAKVRSLDRMRGQTESDRRSLSKSIFRLPLAVQFIHLSNHLRLVPSGISSYEPLRLPSSCLPQFLF